MPQKSNNTSMSCLNNAAKIALGCLALFFGVSLAAGGIASKAAHPGTDGTIDVSEIRPGMTGYGLTAFSGSTPERFGVTVIDIVPNFIPRQSVILIRCDHPITDHAGVIGGMSGSPIYFGDRLAGALGYGWRFNKDPVAAVTPIADMRALWQRRLRGSATTLSQREFAQRISVLPTALANASTIEPAPVPWPAPLSHRAHDHTSLLPVQTPVALSGFSGHAQQLLEDALTPFGMLPMQGGGAGPNGSAQAPQGFVPGSPVGVQLIRGDLSATAIGTVTDVFGPALLAFGHPMMNMGETYLPITTAHIHTVISSVMRSNKLGSPLHEAGSLIQDRQAAIAGRTDIRAPVVPVEITIDTGAAENTETFRVSVAAHSLLTHRLIHSAALAALRLAVADARDVTVEAEGTLIIKGRAPLHLRDASVSRGGAVPLFPQLVPAAITGAVLANPFEPVEIESLQLRFTVRDGLRFATIREVTTATPEPCAGDTINLYVRLQSFGGEERLVTLPFQVPRHAENQRLQITVAGGNSIAPPMAPPENLDDFLANVRRFYPSRALVVQTAAPTGSIAMRGALLQNLPGSTLHSLKGVAKTEAPKSHNVSQVDIVPSHDIIAGKETITLTVVPRSKP